MSESAHLDRAKARAGFELLPASVTQSLPDRIQSMVLSHQYRTGLRDLLKLMDTYPGNAYLLMQAAILLNSALSRSNIQRAALHNEELTSEMLADTRLDPIFNECSKCGSTWVSIYHLMNYAHVSVMNPVGLECLECDIVLCRSCLEKQRFGVDFARLGCPECGGKMQSVSRPTGRSPRQAKRYGYPPELILFFTEGPVPADDQFVDLILRKVCPDVLEFNTRPEIKVIAEEDLSNVRLIARYALLGMNQDYYSESYEHDEIESRYEDEHFYILRLYRNRALEASILSTEKVAELESNIEDDTKYVVAIALSNHADELIKLAHILFVTGNFSALGRALEKAVQINPQNTALAIPFPGATEEKEGTIEKAQQLLEMGMRAFGNDEFDAACLLLEQAIELTPRWAVLYSTIGWFYTKRKIFEHAESALKKAVEIDPELPEAINNMGMLHLFRQDLDEAEECMIRALELRPDYKEAAQNLEDIIDIKNNAISNHSAVFWFDAREISDNESRMYGRYAYMSLLEHFKIKKGGFVPQYYHFCDGDALANEEFYLIHKNARERACVEQILDKGVSACYVIAVYGEGLVDLKEIDHALKDAETTGYIGVTSLRPSYERYVEFTDSISLIYSIAINNGNFERQDFTFLKDQEIEDLGYRVIASR